jgi:hypothetical protein
MAGTERMNQEQRDKNQDKRQKEKYSAPACRQRQVRG